MKLTFAALALLATSPALAGVVMEFTDKQAGEAPTTSKAYIGADRVRIETDNQVVIFRGDKQVVWAVDPKENTYTELTKDGVAGMGDAMKEVQAQLASLPPEQRAMVEQMMKGHGAPGAAQAPAPPAPLTWHANGSSDTVGGRACKGYDGARDGKTEEMICASDWTTFGLTRDDFQALEQFAEFMKTMAGPMAQAMQGRVMDSTYPGVPLRSVSKTPQGDFTHEVTKIEKADVGASLFELPAGAKGESPMEGVPPQGRRRSH